MIKRSFQPRVVVERVLWAGRVAFGNQPSSDTVSGGAIVVGTNGKIQSCHPNIMEHEAKATLLSPTTEFLSFGDEAVILPGLIDVHCHISELGGRDWEGYYHATRAAAAGGVTTLMGMPLNSIPPTVSREAFEAEVQAAERTPLAVDVGLWGGVLPDSNLDEILECGVFGIKAFLAPLPESAGYQAISPKGLSQVATKCGALGLPVLVHSELMTAEEAQAAMDREYDQHPPEQAHVKSRPPQWEKDAVSVVCGLADRCHMHIVHLSDAEGSLDVIRSAKDRHNSRLSVETCPHYLISFDNLLNDDNVLLKCFPPIRSDENRRTLMEAVLKGEIDMLASDHSPCAPNMRFKVSYRDAWGGVSGLQYQLQATLQVLDGLRKDLKYITIARLWGSSPASLVPGMSNIKGRIAPGLLGDLCVIQADDEHIPMSKERHRWPNCSPYTQMSLKGRVVATFLSGQKVYDGETDTTVDDDEAPGSLLRYCGS